MTVIERIPLEDGQRWSDALDQVPHSFYHRRDFALAMQIATRQSAFLLRIRDQDLDVVCVLVERSIGGYRDVATLSGLAGFAGTGTWHRLEGPWRDFVESSGYLTGYIGCHPLFAPADLEQAAAAHNSLYVVGFEGSLYDLQRRMDRNRRRELRGWRDRAVRFSTERDTAAAFLRQHYEPFMSASGVRPPYLSHEALDLLVHSEDTIVVGSRHNGKVNNVFLFGVSPHGGECVINVTCGEGKRRTTDLIWYGINVMHERGLPWLNLGGGAQEDDPIAQAKQRFRPQRYPLRALREVYRPTEYVAVCEERDASAEADYFPAYRAPSIQGARAT